MDGDGVGFYIGVGCIILSLMLCLDYERSMRRKGENEEKMCRFLNCLD